MSNLEIVALSYAAFVTVCFMYSQYSLGYWKEVAEQRRTERGPCKKCGKTQQRTTGRND